VRGNEVLESFYCHLWDRFVRQTSGKSILPRLLPGNGPGGTMHTRLSSSVRGHPDPQLAVVRLRREVASRVSAYNNYFVTIIQHGDWSLSSGNSAAEMDCSSEMASYRRNPSELSDQCDQVIVEIIVATGVWCHPHIFAANNETLKLGYCL
jgi:hypothetical protein